VIPEPPFRVAFVSIVIFLAAVVFLFNVFFFVWLFPEENTSGYISGIDAKTLCQLVSFRETERRRHDEHSTDLFRISIVAMT